jgi:Mce-associated membrane protein
VTSNRRLPPAPSDPGADWARAIAEMTGDAEATAGATAEAINGAGVTTGEAPASGAGMRSAAVTTRGAGRTSQDADGTDVPADADPDAAARHTAVTDAGASDISVGEITAGETAAGQTAAGQTAAEDTAVVEGKPEQPPGRQLQRTVLTAVLGVAIVVVGAFGIWAAVAAHSLRASAADANRAFTDAAATRAVDQQVAAAVNTIFSYSYADTARTRTAAQQLLTGAATSQYNQLFAIVQKQAPTAKLTVTTRVTNIGVELLTGDRARVLVFANQQDTSAGTAKTTYGGAMFAVTAVNQHGKWKIESIDTFTGPA